MDEGTVLPFNTVLPSEAPDRRGTASSSRWPGTRWPRTRWPRACSGWPRWPSRSRAADQVVGDEDDPMDETQQHAVQLAMEHGVSVLTGGPGTGKSRTIAAVATVAAGCGLRLALAAPTGRAARRLAELAGAPATTVHRLL